MTGEFSFFGMYFPWLMFTSLLALIATYVISVFLARIGFYRYVWHPPLFDVALFLVILGIFVVIFNLSRS